MKFLIFADPHWSSYSSIVRSRGSKYSTRLENLIASMNWVEQTALSLRCDGVIGLGDFFDKADLNSEEVTALQEINWCGIPHYFIVGNHEMGRCDLSFSSSHMFTLSPNSIVLDKPCTLFFDDTRELCVLPYILEADRKPLTEYFAPLTDGRSRVILSHNDLSGVFMGSFVSREGFSLEEIEANCDLFINGHLHNNSWVSSKVVNVGNLTGQNFSEDATKYSHNVLLLDTDKRNIEWYENPYAMNFYKFDFSSYDDTEKSAKSIQTTLDSVKNNAVATILVNTESKFIVEDLLSTNDRIISCRIITDALKASNKVQAVSSSDMSIDHLQKFTEYVKEHFDNDKTVMEELQRVLS